MTGLNHKGSLLAVAEGGLHVQSAQFQAGVQLAQLRQHASRVRTGAPGAAPASIARRRSGGALASFSLWVQNHRADL